MKTNEFIEKARIVHGNKYDYSKVEYVHSLSKVIIICPMHGEFLQKPSNHINNRNKCPKCSICDNITRLSSLHLLSTEQFIEKAKIVHGDKYDYSKVEYNNYKCKVIIICPEHGEFIQSPLKHISKKQGCPTCAINKVASFNNLSTEQFIEKAKIIHGDKYDYSKVEYKKWDDFIVIVCQKHGEFLQRPNGHLSGFGCSKCPGAISSEHKIITDILKEHNLSYVDNDRSILNGKELDIFIPLYNIGIEINGYYWHGTNKYHNYDISKHRNKLKLAQDENITLLQFWDYEINNKTNIVKSMILHRLKKSNKVYARSLQVISCDNKRICGFMDKSHLQGHRNASVNYALVRNDEILAVLNFSKHPKHEWEIIRYACKLNHAVIGGFSKLLKRFINDYDPTQIMTFADARYSVGGVYYNNGFETVGHTDANYFYVKNGQLLSRQRCQKHKLHKFLPNFKCELSETDNMLEHGYTKVYDAGHTKLIWNKHHGYNGS